MKKILISDFDDTLYFNGKIYKQDIEAIHEFRQKGNVFVIATGSSYTSFIKKIGDNNLEYDYLIVNHGSTILKNDEVIFNQTINSQIINELVNRFDLNNNYVLTPNTDGNFLSTAKEGLIKPNDDNITKIHINYSI